jgi:hypothetical protein
MSVSSPSKTFPLAVEAGVAQDDLLVVARSGMAEQHLSQPIHGQEE